MYIYVCVSVSVSVSVFGGYSYHVFHVTKQHNRISLTACVDGRNISFVLVHVSFIFKRIGTMYMHIKWDTFNRNCALRYFINLSVRGDTSMLSRQGNTLTTDHITKIGVTGNHAGVIKWKHFPRHWPFVRGIHRSPVNAPHKGQWRGALMCSLICAWINGWIKNREAGDLRCHRAHSYLCNALG